MPSKDANLIRKPLHASERSRRTLDERLSLRFPRLAATSARRLAKLPPGSRIRQAAVWRGAQLASEAYNRRDLEATVIGWHPDFEYYTGRRFVDAGLLEPCYRGLEGYRRYVAATNEVWGGEVYLDPVELIDLGDRLVMLANAPMRAQISGVRLTEAFALVMTVREGRISRIQEYYDHAEALAAAGVRQ